jgi:hypothetical protein
MFVMAYGMGFGRKRYADTGNCCWRVDRSQNIDVKMARSILTVGAHGMRPKIMLRAKQPDRL